jgi:hypothetical protein
MEENIITIITILTKEEKMKRIITATLIFLFMAFPAIAGKTSFLHDFSVDNAKTNAVLIPTSAKYVGVLVPSITNGDVGIEVYESGAIESGNISSAALLASSDTNWNPVIDNADGADAVINASGSDPGWVDITPFVAALKGRYIRFTIGAAQSADTTWYLYYKP